MPVYLVTYDGLYMGGSAIVEADSELQAIMRVRGDKKTTNFKNGEATEVEGPVYHNWDGDY